MTADDCGYPPVSARADAALAGADPGIIAAAPPAVGDIFGDRLRAVERYVALLGGPGVDRGLIGPREMDRVWDRHILNCAVVAELVPSRCRLVDIGSGAGLPGVVLAMLRPDASVVLVESMLRRSAFLDECVADLGLANVEVIRSRAEDLAGKVSADVVTARAVAPLRRLVEWAAGAVRPGGTILAIKGDRAAQELREARSVLRALGVQRAEILTVGQGRVEPETVVVRIVARNGTGKNRGVGVRPRGRRRDRP